MIRIEGYQSLLDSNPWKICRKSQEFLLQGKKGFLFSGGKKKGGTPPLSVRYTYFGFGLGLDSGDSYLPLQKMGITCVCYLMLEEMNFQYTSYHKSERHFQKRRHQCIKQRHHGLKIGLVLQGKRCLAYKHGNVFNVEM